MADKEQIKRIKGFLTAYMVQEKHPASPDFVSTLANLIEGDDLLTGDEERDKLFMREAVFQAKGEFTIDSAEAALEAAIQKGDNFTQSAKAKPKQAQRNTRGQRADAEQPSPEEVFASLLATNDPPDDQLEVIKILAAPFDADDIHDRGGYAFIKEKAIMKRLNDAVGELGWQTEHLVSNNGFVTCRLGLLISGAWWWRSNGSAPQTKDEPGNASQTTDNLAKAAYTDAFKRAARCWYVGAYLLRD